VGDTTNWEFAAAVAAVTMGLGGLLLFTLVGTIGSWRIFDRASRAANESAKASMAVQDLARYLASRETMHAVAPAVDLNQAAGELSSLRQQADSLIGQQTRLQDAVRNLVEAGVLRSEDSRQHLQDLESAVKRLEENLSQIAAAVANLGQRQV
jgi:flagellar biosynthesis chaperone FliJ